VVGGAPAPYLFKTHRAPLKLLLKFKMYKLLYMFIVSDLVRLYDYSALMQLLLFFLAPSLVPTLFKHGDPNA
jgi:hypothetical protein